VAIGIECATATLALLVPAAAFDLLVLGAQVGVLASGGGVGGLDQSGAEIRVALVGLARAALARGLVVARAKLRPARGVPVRREAAHVRSEL
jgi:hypothetical protein